MRLDNQAHCQIDYLPELFCLVQNWQGYAGSKKFRDSIEKTIAFTKMYPVRYIISDTREQQIVASEDVAWLANVGNPHLVAAGVQKLAFIAPKDAFTLMGESNYASRSKGQLEVRWFTDFEEAKAWLLEKET
jgi:hypothetical protein